MKVDYRNSIILLFFAVIPTLWITVNYDFRAGGIYLLMILFVSFVYLNIDKILK